METIDNDVLDVLKDIQCNRVEFNCYPYLKTIYSILCGRSIFGVFTTKQYYGKYPYLNMGSLIICLNDLRLNGFVSFQPGKNGDIMFIPIELRKQEIIDYELGERILKKCYRPDDVLIYSVDEFMDKFGEICLVDNKTCTGFVLPISDTFTYYSDSRDEYNFVKGIKEANIAKVLRGQNYYIEYVSKEYTDHQYIPDVIFLDLMNHVTIIEYKPITNMTYHLTIAKYKWLRYYARKYGFYCGMMDKDFNTFEDLETFKIDSLIRSLFYSIYNESHCFLIEEYKKLCQCFQTDERSINGRIFKNLEAIIVQDGLINSSKSNSIMIYSQDYKKIIPEPEEVIAKTGKRFHF